MAASVRSGVPTLVLWIGADQPVWATRIRRLGVGTSRRFPQRRKRPFAMTCGPLGSQDAPLARAEVANQMTPPSRSPTATVAVLEELAATRA